METNKDSDVGGADERLNSFLAQLQSEYAILDRIVYKNKNQHRRGSYFQYLMKVRRDLRMLLQYVKLEEILVQCFYVIDGKRQKQKLTALESLKKSKRDSGKYNFMERLLGAARLLSQCVEPMLKAASKISTLLAQSFFMSFSVTVLAIISRLRVLVQQILLEVVSVFNTVSSISQQRQSIKIIQDGVDPPHLEMVQVFREYYPKLREIIILECVWETDKFVLIEKKQEIEIKAQDMPPLTSTVKYASIEAFLGDDEPSSKISDPTDITSMITTDPFDAAIFDFSKETQNDINKAKVNASAPKLSTSEPKSSKRKLDQKSRVAFISIRKPTPADERKDSLLLKANSNNDNQLTDVLVTKSSLF